MRRSVGGGTDAESQQSNRLMHYDDPHGGTDGGMRNYRDPSLCPPKSAAVKKRRILPDWIWRNAPH
jgi:hypothetical protein